MVWIQSTNTNIQIKVVRNNTEMPNIYNHQSFHKDPAFHTCNDIRQAQVTQVLLAIDIVASCQLRAQFNSAPKVETKTQLN